MPKSSKVTQREHSNEHVTESVADLLALEAPMDYKSSQMSMAGGGPPPIGKPDISPDLEDGRPAWNSKLQYILAQVGFSVGLGNVWRFPYLCQKNGGGAYLVPYFILLILIGIPLFFLELAVGQRIRRGSIGVWNYVCPRLGGIGVSSLMVCGFVGLYYNVIIGWSIFYFFQSFQYPLPWSACPIRKNGTQSFVEPECEKSSATTYYWYRETLDITSSIADSGGLNWRMTLSLLAAWIIVCLAVIRGIQSSGRVMYFSSLFPYVVLFCFLVRGMFLKGAVDGIAHMFTPKLEIMLEPQVWREAATQVFFALGLGFGGVIAFSSYNKRDNNCHFDAVLVSFINFMTSILATLVVFAVLGFKANIMNEKCVVENAEKILGYLNSNVLSQDLIPPHVNFSHLTTSDYAEMYDVIKIVKEDSFSQLGLEPCLLEDELNKAVQGTGLAFIAFTEAMTHFPGSPFWSVMFFFMLINLGLGSMIGTMTGITTPILDAFKIRKEVLTVGCCIVAFLCGLLFVQRSGNYFVTMFDDYSAGLPLTIVVILENISVAWIYGTKRFMQDLEDMLGFRPCIVYFYLWKYVSPVCLIILISASVVEMAINPPGYNAWVQDLAMERFQSYPPWALVMCFALIVVAMLPLPLVFIARHFNWLPDGSNKLSVSYRKSLAKEASTLEDETRFILGKNPSEAPSPMPSHRAYLGPGSTSPVELITNSTSISGYGSGYQTNPAPPKSES
ncbi:sodium-dependent neutral amino acid transporter SLC6A17 [Pimephales promelas]|uniref:sodium-dependent neutral amino acid transporter SLC6A17 n=1 Tax=Pimephales promelas TaxID=90988 RepID=UPI001955D4B9|nr:sodium-dependent neutral amino acid transporter SLC6A17 [Pimephales promelas]KAG1933112.1 sodium-dependent neutral amino acid transporter B(0)AT2 [Pimephales promelas]KAG1933113.1 sodium-dependent neutral amino acid transporter B(0)AT2 [Pimephales promelas]